jgi:DNA-binding protein HU-beta
VRNPATGEQMKKAADKQVKFAIAKALKDVVNG